ncbi:MAG TPA: PASTA domain-containing protein [Solirubrobacteraceae bacterium]|nr:PASTA domain-containing protein [Solirubrobacteraceae bacterium]
MPRLWIAGIIAAIAALGLAPAAAQATVTATNITSWTSNGNGTPPNSPYLISYDNQPTTLAVTGSAPGAASGDRVDIACYYGSPPSKFKVLVSNLSVSAQQTFATASGTSAPQLRLIAGHACRLRAVPHSGEANGDASQFAGPQVAVAETALLPTISGGINNGKAYNYYVNGMTFTGFAAWKAAGTPATSTTGACGGPYAAPVNQALDAGTFPIDCAGSLLDNDLGIWGGRSEVQIDGRDAYDAASAQALFARTSGDNGSEDLTGFPSLSTSVDFDPTTGLISSQAQESWVACHGPEVYPATSANCLSFDNTGVRLTRVVTTSDGGRVITLTDTWSSTDGNSHSLDLLYDDYAGVAGNADSERGWQFPGQSGFTQYGTGDSVAAPSAVPGSILVRTNVTAPDGDPSEGYGAITFGSAPSGLRFASDSELEEHRLLSVPAGGSASLSYVYSIATSQADITALALAAEDRFQPAAVHIASPASGTAVSSAVVAVTGTAIAGSGITSLVVGGQAVPVAPGGTWSAQVPLSPGQNTITALATDGAGATAQDQVTVVYQPPAPSSLPPTPFVAKCHVPRVKGMKLRAAEKALRKANCKVGKVKHVTSRKLARGRVTSTTPRAGRWLPAGHKIEMLVSTGRYAASS